MENIKYCETCNKVRTTGSLGNSQAQGIKLLSLLNSQIKATNKSEFREQQLVQTLVNFWSSRESNEILTEEKPGYYVCSHFNNILQFCLLVNLCVLEVKVFSFPLCPIRLLLIFFPCLQSLFLRCQCDPLPNHSLQQYPWRSVKGKERKHTVSSFQLCIQRFTLPLANAFFSRWEALQN